MPQQQRLNRQRNRRRLRVRNRVKRDSNRPRLTVFRSNKHMYAQVIDDDRGRTLFSASTTDKQLRDSVPSGATKDAAAAVGKALAERALEAGIQQVALDRREYKYHGRVAALTEAARQTGLKI